MFVLVLSALVMVVQFVPGDPARTLAQASGGRPSAQYIESIRVELKLNESIPSQLASFFGGLVRGTWDATSRAASP